MLVEYLLEIYSIMRNQHCNFLFFKEFCVAQLLKQSTGNRKTWARIPAQSKASFLTQTDSQIL